MPKKGYMTENNAAFDLEDDVSPQGAANKLLLSEAQQEDIARSKKLKASSSERIIKVAINNIVPDSRQPRKVIPLRLERTGSPTLDITNWAQLANISLSEVYGVIRSDVELPDEFSPRVWQQGFIELVFLAKAIFHDGLIHPITTIKQKDTYILETGERRWLAYHLLYMLFNDEQWSSIPSRVFSDFDVWRQADENNARTNLNAISKARQFAILMMNEINYRFKDLEDFDTEQAYYAQVADSEQFRIPRGKGERFASATGLSVKQLRDYRALLRLPNEMWVQADNENLTEHYLRDYTAPTGTVSKKKKKTSSPTLSRSIGTFKKRMSKNRGVFAESLKNVGEIGQGDVEKIVSVIDDEIEALMAIRRELEG